MGNPVQQNLVFCIGSFDVGGDEFGMSQRCSEDLDPPLTMWQIRTLPHHGPGVLCKCHPFQCVTSLWTNPTAVPYLGLPTMQTDVSVPVQRILEKRVNVSHPLPEWSRCRCHPDTRTSSRLRETDTGRTPMRRAGPKRTGGALKHLLGVWRARCFRCPPTDREGWP